MIVERFRGIGPVSQRYVRRSIKGTHYEWCERSADDPRFDVAQGICDAEDLPEHIRVACDLGGPRGDGLYAVAWPL